MGSNASVSEDSGTGNTGFKIVTGDRVWLLKAETEEDKRAWMRDVARTIERTQEEVEKSVGSFFGKQVDSPTEKLINMKEMFNPTLCECVIVDWWWLIVGFFLFCRLGVFGEEVQV